MPRVFALVAEVVGVAGPSGDAHEEHLLLEQLLLAGERVGRDGVFTGGRKVRGDSATLAERGRLPSAKSSAKRARRELMTRAQ